MTKNNLTVILMNMQESSIKNYTLGRRNPVIKKHIQILNYCHKKNIPICEIEKNNRSETVFELQEILQKILRYEKAYQSPYGRINKKEFYTLGKFLYENETKEVYFMGGEASNDLKNFAKKLKAKFKISTSGDVILDNKFTNKIFLNRTKKWFSKNGLYSENFRELPYFKEC